MFDYSFKLVLIGDSGVGKSNVLSKYARDEFDLNTKSTIGVEFKSVNKIIDDKNVNIQIWDTAGQERYRAITTAYYRGAVGVIIVFDLTNINTFNNVIKWYKEVLNHVNESDITIMLVGNKSDLSYLRAVNMNDAKQFAQRYKMFYIETSALNATNIHEAFEYIINEIYDKKNKISRYLNDDFDDIESNSEIIKIDDITTQNNKKCSC